MLGAGSDRVAPATGAKGLVPGYLSSACICWCHRCCPSRALWRAGLRPVSSQRQWRPSSRASEYPPCPCPSCLPASLTVAQCATSARTSCTLASPLLRCSHPAPPSHPNCASFITHVPLCGAGLPRRWRAPWRRSSWMPSPAAPHGRCAAPTSPCSGRSSSCWS
jgi:hypothetical protein